MLRLARHAMATRFELVLHGPRPEALQAAGEEALEEIARLEERLSLYRPSSDISRLNAQAAHSPVRVPPDTFALLQRALDLARATGGAFDPTAGPLVRAWGFHGGTGKTPDPTALAEARAATGFTHVELDPQALTVRFHRPGMMLDLGAIGKGHALDRAADLLRDAGIDSALLHGGTSTVVAIGRPPDAEAWTIGLPRDPDGDQPPAPETLWPATVTLRDESLSVSAVWGRSFRPGERELGHVLDPRTGEPVTHCRAAAVIHPLAADSDALSTALLVTGNPDGFMVTHQPRWCGWLAGPEHPPDLR